MSDGLLSQADWSYVTFCDFCRNLHHCYPCLSNVSLELLHLLYVLMQLVQLQSAHTLAKLYKWPAVLMQVVTITTNALQVLTVLGETAFSYGAKHLVLLNNLQRDLKYVYIDTSIYIGKSLRASLWTWWGKCGCSLESPLCLNCCSCCCSWVPLSRECCSHDGVCSVSNGVWVDGACQSGIHTNVRTRGFPAEHCILMSYWCSGWSAYSAREEKDSTDHRYFKDNQIALLMFSPSPPLQVFFSTSIQAPHNNVQRHSYSASQSFSKHFLICLISTNLQIWSKIKSLPCF